MKSEIIQIQKAIKQKILLRICNILIIAIALTYIPNLLNFEWTKLAIGALVIGFAFLLRQLAAKGEIILCSQLLVTSFSIVIFTYAAFQGRAAGTQIHFVTAILTASIFLANLRPVKFMFFLLFPITLWFVLEFFGYEYFENTLFSEQQIIANRIVNLIAFIIMILYYSYLVARYYQLFTKSIMGYEQQITSKNKALNIQISQLAALNKKLERLNDTLSHDLRSPLSSLKGLVSLLKGTSPEEETELIKNIHEQIDKMLAFTKTIIEKSRENNESKPEVVYLKELLSNIIESNVYLNLNGKIEFDFSGLENDLNVKCNSFYLNNILQNIISNAIKYADPKKRVNEIKIEGKKYNHYVELSIYDNGVGMHPKMLKNAFKKFNRGDQKKADESSGVGLHLVKEYAEMMGAEINLQSERELYTKFVLKLPQ